MHDGRFPLALADPALSWLRGKWTTVYVRLFLSLSLSIYSLSFLFSDMKLPGILWEMRSNVSYEPR